LYARINNLVRRVVDIKTANSVYRIGHLKCYKLLSLKVCVESKICSDKNFARRHTIDDEMIPLV